MCCFPNLHRDGTLPYLRAGVPWNPPACIPAQPPHTCTSGPPQLRAPRGNCLSHLILSGPQTCSMAPQCPQIPIPPLERPYPVPPASLIAHLPQPPPPTLRTFSLLSELPVGPNPRPFHMRSPPPGKLLCILQGLNPPSSGETSLLLPSLAEFRDFLPQPHGHLCNPDPIALSPMIWFPVPCPNSTPPPPPPPVTQQASMSPRVHESSGALFPTSLSGPGLPPSSAPSYRAGGRDED